MPREKANSSSSESPDSAKSLSKKSRFLTGVIEGFYNRPWSMNQRLHLFKLMKNFGLNSYLYAPKDDHKHRAMWREGYTEAEMSEMKELIDACKDNEVIFFYGISPGLDMSYSSAKVRHPLIDPLS